ncbi:MAG: hypothetical protein Q7R41_17690, partial [Phycisphaerales bacterium]|nr:hypothetical protein [Phycisphaerales bacterium]
MRLLATKRLTKPAVQFGIACFPKLVAGMNPAEIKIAIAKFNECLGAAILHGIDASAFLVLIGMSGVQNHTISWLERSFQLYGDGL